MYRCLLKPVALIFGDSEREEDFDAPVHGVNHEADEDGKEQVFF